MLTVISCPDCGVPAEITDRFSLASTDGPVGHVAVCCAAGHHAAACAPMVNKSARERKMVEWDFAKDDIRS